MNLQGKLLIFTKPLIRLIIYTADSRFLMQKHPETSGKDLPLNTTSLQKIIAFQTFDVFNVLISFRQR